ncbi:Sideroflexin-1 [Phytophthora nicotianae]|uniref:Sideroflexin-1 n=1 Tax=Phytophthora nicotianae TaxID=4792 RepID=A0A0W8DFF7_PHYNI|nr:Sideroflexin-1 [Phytophthora nicotianae]
MAAQNLSVILIQKRVRGMLCRSANGRQQVSKKMNIGRARSPMQQFVTRGGKYSDERGFPTGSRRAVDEFHYSKLVRQQDRERARRHKKRLWMQKLYTQGLLTAADRPEELRDEDQTVKQPSLLFDVDFEDENWEAEAEEMFQWASALDYDEYVDNWYELGGTAATDDELQ